MYSELAMTGATYHKLRFPPWGLGLKDPTSKADRQKDIIITLILGKSSILVSYICQGNFEYTLMFGKQGKKINDTYGTKVITYFIISTMKLFRKT